jgi:hypothetical protein
MDLRKTATARGLRNNNPFNMNKTAIKWQGKTTGTDTRFETFDSIENGIRAGVIDIVGDIAKKGQNTLEKLFLTFAPPSENDTTNYINYVSKVSGIDPKASLLQSGKVNPEILYKIVPAIIRHENGTEANKIDAATIKKGIDLALSSASIKTYIVSQPVSKSGANDRLNDLSGLFLMVVVFLLILISQIK